DSTGLKSAAPGAAMPYSVSMPITLGMAMTPCPRGFRLRRTLDDPGRTLQVLPRGHALDLATGPALVSDQCAHVDDPLARLPADARPVVGVRRVRQVLVLLEFVGDRGGEVLCLEALLAGLEEALDGGLLGPRDDVLDHGAGVEVLEIQDLLVAAGVGDL